MFNIAIPIIPIGFIADTFYIDRFCSDRFHTDTFHSDMFCLGTYHFDPNADPNFLDADPDPDFYLMSSVSGSGSRFPK